MVRCNNMTTFVKMDMIRSMEDWKGHGVRDKFMDNDPAVITEALMMAFISVKCNHIAGGRTSLAAYERVNMPRSC
jgi:hypothetical protein